MSPFDPGQSPARFVFLVGAATTGLTLVIIVNQFRDRLLRRKFIVANLRAHIRVGYLLAFAQLFLLNFILLRILLSAFAEVPLLFDRALVVCGFLTLGVGWMVYFIWVTIWTKLKNWIKKVSKERALIYPLSK
ncbi:MAG: hypothetical protein A2038_09845 [Deltaproteobacteria bacterium GWA2_57_13]|nr:MAG: hypothetical protein A2038_09845 [Deltaproteobacteria bacterium GWA2_57_13]OGQ24426.1 MAG: hypothetical protein A3C54_07800 [Deltaproteobacteria bacterium RIFCSPHIGHO2_02_FULL_60_17]OGQ51933.1 MAG: hypothetical protein A3I10_03580 [Deltaproteobacteria bacterium RIFCSPLOWO2_02_FULL_57_26]OGQ81917.1 MAG: hypothetical protein A3G40_09775 [Deltaproteobacteria bacterium RIFCSPLOWO2_12_FULL_57_22]